MAGMALFSLDGRVALVTGASRGLGFAMAEALAEAGATVVLNSRHADTLETAARQANHFPWSYRYRPELTPQWRDLGNEPKVDEYVRRQTISAHDYAEFLGRLKREFPGEAFLVVRYGDHQPEFAMNILDPKLDEAAIARRIETRDPRYLTTYYAIDAVNFIPA